MGIMTIFCIHAGNTEYHILKEQVISEFKNQGILIGSELNFDAIDQQKKNLNSQDGQNIMQTVNEETRHKLSLKQPQLQ